MLGNIVKNPHGTLSKTYTTNGTEIVNVSRYKNIEIVRNVSQPHIYGATWAGGSSSAWTRTDEAAGITEPVPYYAGMSGSPQSFFDSVMPWAGMRRVTDATAGELVEIPKFWYKWTRSGTSMQLQIADAPVGGFLVSPAHADRGDGVGERDFVYIGRYHCASDYKSKTGVTPKNTITRATFRSNIHNLGANVWQQDFALFWTIRMLYLVEFADWNSQAKIGYGCCTTANSIANTGSSDAMPYHTGTMQTGRTTYGLGTQYRYIEGLWENEREFCDGIYCSGTDVYCIKNPANFSDNTGGTKTGTRSTKAEGYISAWNTPSAEGFEYALFPSAANGAASTYICDLYYYSSGGTNCITGGSWAKSTNFGLFFIDSDYDATASRGYIGSRLMVLPSAQIK